MHKLRLTSSFAESMFSERKPTATAQPGTAARSTERLVSAASQEASLKQQMRSTLQQNLQKAGHSGRGDGRMTEAKTQSQSVRSLGTYTDSVQRGRDPGPSKAGMARSPEPGCVTVQEMLKSPELSKNSRAFRNQIFSKTNVQGYQGLKTKYALKPSQFGVTMQEATTSGLRVLSEGGQRPADFPNGRPGPSKR